MGQAALYDEDIHAWSQHQARVLRARAGAGARLPNDLDPEHVAEEIEDLGKEQRFQVESNLGQALDHRIKVVALPQDQAARHGIEEADAFPTDAARRCRPSMRRVIAPARILAWARRDAAADLEFDGHAMPPPPADLPFGIEELVGETADARALAARLAARLGPPLPSA
ncbi:DUF29 family protein [Dankookia sp. GCM10030260]|uniref:DUF29 family protein n=1 Tax=Dankookia sp. GCM10030260 TaxID=3273390 RepID=UPI0036132DFA